MLNKPTRNHWTKIILDIFKYLKDFIFLIIIFISLSKKSLIVGGIILLVVLLALSIKKWYSTVFYINDNMLVYNTGILATSKQEIPFDKISTIDLGQSLFDRVFGTCTVKVDSGSAIGKASEFRIMLKYALAKELRHTIISYKNNDTEGEGLEEIKKEEPIKKVISFKDIALYSATKGNLGWALGGFFAIMNFADDIEGFINTSILKNLSKSIDFENMVLPSISRLIVVIIAMFALIYIIITLLAILYETVKIYNFTIMVENNNFNISYGLISSKEYSIPIEKIHALKYKQSILQQLLGIYTLEAITIGYGDEKNEKAILYPIANKKFMDEFLVKLLPEITFSSEVIKPPKSSLKRFIVKRTLIPLIILVTLGFIIKDMPIEFKIGVIVVISLINILLGYLNYKNTSLGITEKTIIATRGSLTRVTTLIKQSSIQSIQKVQNPFQRKAKVCDYKVGIYSNFFGETVKVRHMSESVEKDLYDNLII